MIRLRRLTSYKMIPRCVINTVPSLRSFFEDKYNTEEFEKILKILNDTKHEDDFKRYIISSKRIQDLMRLKQVNGTFSHLDDLIPVIGVKMLEKFYGSMLEKKSLGLGNPMVPNIPLDRIASFSNVLSFNVTGNKIAWCLSRRIDNKSIHLDSLEVKAFEMVPKTHFLNVLNQIVEVVDELPLCDLVVCEEVPSQVPSSYMFSFHLQMTQARSMVLGYLAARPIPPEFVSIKAIAIAKLFNTYVGSEKVSGQHVVDDLFESSRSLEMTSHLRHYYLDADAQTKEYLSNAFLVNLAYWKLTNQFTSSQTEIQQSRT